MDKPRRRSRGPKEPRSSVSGPADPVVVARFEGNARRRRGGPRVAGRGCGRGRGRARARRGGVAAPRPDARAASGIAGFTGLGFGRSARRARAGTGRRAPRSARREAPRAARGSGARGRDAHLADGLRDDLEAAGAARGPAARRAQREPPASLLAAHETHRPRLRARGRRRDRAARRRGGARRRHRTRHVNRRHRNRRHRVCRSSHDPAKRDDECPSRLARGAPPDRRVAKKRTRKPVWMRHFRRGR